MTKDQRLFIFLIIFTIVMIVIFLILSSTKDYKEYKAYIAEKNSSAQVYAARHRAPGFVLRARRLVTR